ncbi:RHS repeat domain-containing protein, partial [Cohnella luojiensis]
SGGNGNSGGNDSSGGNGNSNGNGNGNSGGNGNGGGNDGNGNGNGKDKENGNGNGKDNSDNGGGCGWLKSLEKGNGKKLGLYKKLGGGSDIDTLFETGQMEHILAAIDNIVNGEVNLPPGEHTKLFERIREVGKGYTVIGTNYTYNTRNQLVHRENLTRYEEYDYKYDDQGSLLTDSRSKYEWNALGQLTKVTFPDGFGEKYAYDMLGRRTSKTQYNHTGETQDVTNFTYKGDTWVITEERNELGEVTKSYTFDANDRPLSITFKGETFWYVYNGHGDVMAMTDKDGTVAARYEYDAWGLVTRMYNRYGERVREGIGWIGDLGTGNGSPGSVQGPEDDSGNIEPDYHPGNVNGNGKGNSKGAGTKEEAATETAAPIEEESSEAPIVTLDLSAILTEETDPTEDITTDLVKENPFRYAGYYFDRKTQYYYLQARYYDPRPARFISEDTYEGEIENPLTLNLYTYTGNNPLKYTDLTGHNFLGDVWDTVTYPVKKTGKFLNDQQQYVQRQVWKKILIPKFIESKGFMLTGKLLRHSLQDKPSTMIFSDQTSYEVKLVRKSKEYKIIMNNYINKATNSGKGYFSITSASDRFKSGDLNAAINKFNYSIYGFKKKDGKWSTSMSINDVYDFKWGDYSKYLTKGDWENLKFWLGNDLAFFSQETTALNKFTSYIIVNDIFN